MGREWMRDAFLPAMLFGQFKSSDGQRVFPIEDGVSQVPSGDRNSN